MQTIIPAIIPESITTFKRELERVSAFSHTIQIDIVDGRFVPFRSWPYEGGDTFEAIRPLLGPFEVEFDLMVEEPETVVDKYLELGAKRIVVHLESTEKIEDMLSHHREHSYALGLSLGNDTPLEELTRYVADADYVQLMGIADIGAQGQPFDERVLARIEELRSAYPHLEISIDGSVNEETLPRLKTAGATRFISGSALLTADDPAAMYRRLTELAA